MTPQTPKNCICTFHFEGDTQVVKEYKGHIAKGYDLPMMGVTVDGIEVFRAVLPDIFRTGYVESNDGVIYPIRRLECIITKEVEVEKQQ